MTLAELGYNDVLEQARIEHRLEVTGIGRIMSEHRERYVVGSAAGEFDAEITGNMRFAARGREDFPAVGDWVGFTVYEPDLAIIHTLLPRTSAIKRQAVGQFGEVQVLAANVDHAFVVQALDRDFKVNRLERYLTVCYSSGVGPVIVLTKADLAGETELAERLERVKSRISGIPVLAISNHTREGYDLLRKMIEPGKTYCMLGSSGVGKSTLLNNLAGHAAMKTGPVSGSTHKGRHVTSHRELIVLESGGILIDNPGMREVGVADEANGLENTFGRIIDLSEHCRFKDCTHVSEAGCAVLEAVEKGEIDRAAYGNYLKMERERAYFESTVAERRKKDRMFGKILKDYHKKASGEGKH